MRFYLIAGEPSGDKLGAALMAGLKQLLPEVEFFGVGGPLMQAEGLSSLFDMSELSVMGLAEVLPKLRGLFRRRDECVADIKARHVDALITIDSPDFCLRVAKKVSEIPKVHYVAPSVWAWRPGRAEKMRGVVDHVLALLPFEPPYMQAAGMTCDFVGHPVVSEPVATDAEIEAFRDFYGIGDAQIVLALPGSRAGEVTRLAGVFGETLSHLERSPDAFRVIVPAAGAVADLVKAQVKHWPGQPIVLDPRDRMDWAAWKTAAFGAADVALAASGTVSLELAASATPMVIAYDMNWMSRQMIKRLLRVDTVTLVNLVSETRAVPEFLGENCKPELIAQALINVMRDPAAQIDACEVTMDRLGRGGEAPGLRAARSVLNAIA